MAAARVGAWVKHAVVVFCSLREVLQVGEAGRCAVHSLGLSVCLSVQQGVVSADLG